MTVRESLQTIAALKEQEISNTNEKEKKLQEFEELKRDFFLLMEEHVTEWLNTGIDNITDAALYFYQYEPEIIEELYNELLTRFTKSEIIKGSSFIDKNGKISHRVQTVGKYTGYNQDILRSLLPKLSREYLKAAKDNEIDYKRLLKEKEKTTKETTKKESEDKFKMFIDCLLMIYKRQNVSINQFIVNINTPTFKKIFFEELELDSYDYETIKAYNRAIKEFSKEYQEPETSEPERRTIAGLSLGAFTLAGIVGFFEAFKK